MEPPEGDSKFVWKKLAWKDFQTWFSKPGVAKYCVGNLLLLCINPSTLYGFDYAV